MEVLYRFVSEWLLLLNERGIDAKEHVRVFVRNDSPRESDACNNDPLGSSSYGWTACYEYDARLDANACAWRKSTEEVTLAGWSRKWSEGMLPSQEKLQSLGARWEAMSREELSSWLSTVVPEPWVLLDVLEDGEHDFSGRQIELGCNPARPRHSEERS